MKVYISADPSLYQLIRNVIIQLGAEFGLNISEPSYTNYQEGIVPQIIKSIQAADFELLRSHVPSCQHWTVKI